MSTTGPVIWTTRPVAPAWLSAFFVAVAVAMVGIVLLVSGRRSARAGAGGDLDHLAGDVGLANLVVGEGQVVDELFGILGGVLHRHHPAGFLARLRLEHGLEDARRHVAWDELLQDGRSARLEDELVAGYPGGVLGRLDRQELVHDRLLSERRDEAAVDDVDSAVVAGEGVVGPEAGEPEHVGEGRSIAEARQVGLHRDARPTPGVP